MNKAQSIQRSKLITSYGGVGSIIDTIDNLAYIIEPFDNWKIYERYRRRPNNFTHLTTEEERLKIRLHNIGFTNLQNFFLTDDEFDDVKTYDPDDNQVNRMATAKYAPQWFYCEKCHKLKNINDWRNVWFNSQNNSMPEPKCIHCGTGQQRIRAPRLRQVRFVLASLENGELKDLPWDKLWKAKNGHLSFNKGQANEVQKVWDFRQKIDSNPVTYHVKKGGSDLIDIYIKSRVGTSDVFLTMAEIMNHYFILEDGHVYRPVIRSANNVYFPYVMSSLYVPRHMIKQEEVDTINNCVKLGIVDADKIRVILPKLSIAQIQFIIDNRVAPNPDYTTEESFRLDEYNYITNEGNYDNDGKYATEDGRLVSWRLNWETQNNQKPTFIKGVYLLKHLEITSVQVAYSRLEAVTSPNFSTMTGSSKKQWFKINEGRITNPERDTIQVGLHLTCNCAKDHVRYMPAVLSRGEGFFVELDLANLEDDFERKQIFTHTFSHLVMKELEFSCGYPLPSMNERLYMIPASDTNDAKFGFLVYSANGEAGSYGGMSSLFEAHKIEKILNNAVLLAEDCPNDPICESEGANCFACVQIPETACEKFNMFLNRNIFGNVCRENFGMNNFTEQVDQINSEMVQSQTPTQTKEIEPINKEKTETKSQPTEDSRVSSITAGIVLG